MNASRRRRISRIVIVEPHDDSRELYADYFRWAGLRVTAVRSAADALRILSSRVVPDAVITCLRLPSMDGFALCDALRATPRTSRIPVIGVSSCLPDHQRATGDTRFATVLLKPCSPLALLDSLRVALGLNIVHMRLAPL